VQYYLGSTWCPPEEGWMLVAATIRIAAPQTPIDRLVTTGYCPQELSSSGPPQIHISTDGNLISGEEFIKPERASLRTVSLPAQFAGQAS
jgi:hypothetical protein